MMTAFTLGEATALALGRVGMSVTRPSGAPVLAHHIRSAPVRRGSIEAGSFEHGFFAAPAPGETDRLLRTARAALDAGRMLKRRARVDCQVLSVAERALAALTASTIRVYEELLTLARLNKGQVHPSYDHLAAATALGRATVARALHLLEGAGFLARQRRFIRVEGEGSGPRYAQTSNVYRPMLPKRLLGLLPRRFRPAPMPSCALQHAMTQADEVAAMRATLNCRELAETIAGGPLGQMLAKLGAALDLHQCESHCDPETQPKSFK